MEKANKNTHLNHLEDNIFLGHIDGTREAIKFIREFRDVLKGHTDRPSGGTSVKWDGAPAIWAGPHPESGKFFVAKKSLFNKTPLYYTSIKQIENSNDLSQGLKDKFKLAFNKYKDANMTTIIQGDFLFDSTDLKYEQIDGERYLIFQPNTIVYAFPANSDIAMDLDRKDMGIVWHTSYKGKTIESLNAKAGVVLPKNPLGVWQISADLPDMSGAASLTKNEGKAIDKELTNIGFHFRQVSRATFDKLNDPVIAALATTYTNSFVRANTTPTPEEAAKGLPDFITKKFEAEVAKRKTAAAQARQREALASAIDPIMSVPKHELLSMFHLYYSLQRAKNVLVDKLSQAGFIKTFLKTQDGWKVTGQEGFVATDKLKQNTLKLVDRLEFSYANFSDDVIKGWESDLRR